MIVAKYGAMTHIEAKIKDKAIIIVNTTTDMKANVEVAAEDARRTADDGAGRQVAAGCPGNRRTADGAGHAPLGVVLQAARQRKNEHKDGGELEGIHIGALPPLEYAAPA